MSDLTPFCRFCKQTGAGGKQTPAGFVCRVCIDADTPKLRHAQEVNDLIAEKLGDRMWEGIAYHGGGLRPGVDYLRRAFNEALDLVIYLAAEIKRRDG